MRANTHASSGKRAALAVTLIFSASAGIAACGSDTNEKPPPTTFTTSSTTGAGAGSTTTATAATGAGGAAATTTTTTTGNGGATATTATGVGGAGGQPDCHGPNDCYKCAPKTEPQFLNACTDSQCSPFDNVARLPLYNNGNLPPIP